MGTQVLSGCTFLQLFAKEILHWLPCRCAHSLPVLEAWITPCPVITGPLYQVLFAALHHAYPVALPSQLGSSQSFSGYLVSCSISIELYEDALPWETAPGVTAKRGDGSFPWAEGPAFPRPSMDRAWGQGHWWEER